MAFITSVHAFRVAASVGIAIAFGGSASACFAPATVAAPEPARTNGQGEVRLQAKFELPSLNLVSNGDPELLEAEGFLNPILGGEIGIGLTDSLDLEAGVNIPLHYLLLPIPNSAWLGGRVHAVGSENFDLGLAARIGGLTTIDGDEGDDGSEGSDPSAKAAYFTLSAVTEFGSGDSRPGISLRYSSYDVSTNNLDGVLADFTASTSSATFFYRAQAGRLYTTPYLAVAYFDSPNITENDVWLSVGIAFGFGPDHKEPQPLPYQPAPAQPYQAPPQQGPPGSR